MRKKIVYTIAALMAVTLVGFTSCNQQDADQGKNDIENQVERQDDTSLSSLKEELQDVGAEIEQLTTQETQAFKSHAEAVITMLNARIENFQIQAEEKGEQISDSTKDAISRLEQQADTIESKLKVFGETTEKKASEFKEELKSDFNSLGESINNFFTGNT